MSAAERLPVDNARLDRDGAALSVFPTDQRDQNPNVTSLRQRIWGLTEGAAGMVSQVKGLAHAVGWPFENRDSILKQPVRSFWPGFLPRSLKLLKGDWNLGQLPPPRLVISCGRQAVVASTALKKMYGDEVFTVHIQHPRIGLSNFDLILVPEHDGLTGPNVMRTLGAIHHVSQDLLAHEKQRGPTEQMQVLKGPFVGVILGGPNKYFKFKPDHLSATVQQIKNLVTKSGQQIAVVPSRRTPQEIVRLFQKEFGDNHFVWTGKGENPYMRVLALAERLILTGDSVSMVSEAAATLKPLHVVHLPESRPAKRFRQFHESFEQAGITRPFNGSFEDWTYANPDRTQLIASMILDHLESR